MVLRSVADFEIHQSICSLPCTGKESGSWSCPVILE